MTHVNACKVTTIFAKFNDKTLLFFNICHQKTPESTIFDMYITLRERNLDVVLIQCVIDAAQYLTLHQRLFGDVNPAEELHVHAVVSKFCNNGGQGFFTVDIGTFQCPDSLHHQIAHLLDVAAIGHTEANLRQLIAMIACQVLVVLGKQLRVL